MTSTAAPRRRRRWPIVLVVLVILLALLAVAAEFAARQVAAGYVRDRIAEPLGIDRPAEVDVDLGSGSVLLQALQGHVSVITVTSDDAELAGVSARVRLVARNVSIGDREAGAVRATVAVPNQASLKQLTGVDVDTVRFRDDRLAVAKRLSLFGAGIDVAETLTVSADGGRIVFTPETITVGGSQLGLDDVRRSPLANPLSGLTQAQSRCIDSELPRGLHVESARVDGSTLRLLVTGILVKLDGSARGSCS